MTVPINLRWEGVSRRVFPISPLMCRAILFWIVVCSAGCARKSLDPISAETLIGQWRAVTKHDADQGNATRDARTPTGETVAFRYEFRADGQLRKLRGVDGRLGAQRTLGRKARCSRHLECCRVRARYLDNRGF